MQACSCVNPASRAGVFQGFSLSFSKNRFFSLPGLRCSPLSQFPWVGRKYFCLFLFSLLWMIPRVRLDTAGRTGSGVMVFYEVVSSMKSP